MGPCIKDQRCKIYGISQDKETFNGLDKRDRRGKVVFGTTEDKSLGQSDWYFEPGIFAS